jgi:glycine/D-amino acid oxidase-like deaminating enzyme
VGGAAGAAIAHKLAEQGKRVTLLYRNDVDGATDTNQKWLHSGLLYLSGRLAERTWKNRTADWTVKERYVRGPQQARILALNSKTLAAREELWAEWERDSRAVPKAVPLSEEEKFRLRTEGMNFADGWTTPDCAIDFSEMVCDLRLNLEGKLGDNTHLPPLKQLGRVIEGARVLRLRRGRNGIDGVEVERNGDHTTLSCRQCVLAAGAWSLELLSEASIRLPLIRKKCLVLSIDRKRLPVDKITVWLDVAKEDGTFTDVTLVPFGEFTLAAGTDFRVVYRLRDRKLEDLLPGASEIQALLNELKQCHTQVSGLTPADCNPRTCFKTEHYNPAHPHVDLKIYTHDASGHGHDVAGLIVALPGKASLMFDLAREVARLIP